MMMKKRFRAWINFARTRSFPGTDVGSDHDLVMMTFRVHLRKVNKQKETRLKFNLEKLKDPNIHKTFQAMIGGKFAPLTILKDTEEGSYWTHLRGIFPQQSLTQPWKYWGNTDQRRKNGS